MHLFIVDLFISLDTVSPLVSALNKTHLHYQSYAVSGDWAVDEFYIVK